MHRLYLAIILFIAIASCNKNPLDMSNTSNYPGSISGTVKDKYNFPVRTISQARVFLSSLHYIDSTLTDSSGFFQFNQIPADSYQLVITANTYDTVTTAIVLHDGGTIPIDVELSLIYEYELGTILAGFKDTTSVVTAFVICSQLGLTLARLNGFDHISTLPTDSLVFARNILHSKSYLSCTEYTVFSYNDTIRVGCTFYSLTNENIADWMETQNQLKIVSVPSIYRNGEIHTQSGQEVFWVRELRNYPIIEWLELNYRIPIIFP
jgi:hypothetical protein